MSETEIETDGEESPNFPFEEGDTVLVRVRENGDSGTIIAKFEAECDGFTRMVGGSQMARLSLPWGLNNTVSLRYYEAEFEVVSDE